MMMPCYLSACPDCRLCQQNAAQQAKNLWPLLIQALGTKVPLTKEHCDCRAETQNAAWSQVFWVGWEADSFFFSQDQKLGDVSPEHSRRYSPVVPEVKMKRVGDLREVVARKIAGKGLSVAASMWSNMDSIFVSPQWLFIAHTWMLSSSRLLTIPPTHSTKSERRKQSCHNLEKDEYNCDWIIYSFCELKQFSHENEL